MGVEQNQSHVTLGERASRQQPYPAEKTRQGEIILSTPTRRRVFIAGLLLLGLFGLLLAVVRIVG